MKYACLAALAAATFSVPAFAQDDGSGFSLALRTGMSELNHPTY